ncbi:MAG: hypothetical protein IJV14_14090 [Lachnospiraceae bacterium]|nr:hypothetical protein [Lachnospiraceae bacterium]
MYKVDVLLPWKDDSDYNFDEFDKSRKDDSSLLAKICLAGLTFLMCVIYLIPG